MHPDHAGGRACASTEEHLPHIWPENAKATERWQCLGHSGMPATEAYSQEDFIIDLTLVDQLSPSPDHTMTAQNALNAARLISMRTGCAECAQSLRETAFEVLGVVGMSV